MRPQSFQKPPVPVQSGISPGRDLTQEPVLNLAAIQGDLLLGHMKRGEAHIFFEIIDLYAFVDFLINLPITSAADVYRPRGSDTATYTGQEPPNPRFAVGFTLPGLVALNRDPGTVAGLEAFAQNMHGRAVAELNDPDPSTWKIGRPDQTIHGVFVITGKVEGDIDDALNGPFSDPAGSGYRVIGDIERGNVRPEPLVGHEHFGFLDGVSQPGIRGCVDAAQTIPLTENSRPEHPDQGLPGQKLIWPGEFVFGYPEQDGNAPDFTVKGPVKEPPVPWMKDGSFMVIRRLTQAVPEMHAGVEAATPAGQRPEQLKAQIVGRWPNGAPIVTHPDDDDPDLGTDENRNNDFKFGGDRHGLTCPWAAHIRKTYPRDDVRGSIAPADQAEIDAEEARTQTHRLLRRGIQFGPELSADEQNSGQTELDRGLHFKCYVTDLAGQFEFVQKLWANNPGFVQANAGHDPIIGQVAGGADRDFAGVGFEGFKRPFTFKPWVTMTGGAYFFAPSLDFINGLNATV